MPRRLGVLASLSPGPQEEQRGAEARRGPLGNLGASAPRCSGFVVARSTGRTKRRGCAARKSPCLGASVFWLGRRQGHRKNKEARRRRSEISVPRRLGVLASLPPGPQEEQRGAEAPLGNLRASAPRCSGFVAARSTGRTKRRGGAARKSPCLGASVFWLRCRPVHRKNKEARRRGGAARKSPCLGASVFWLGRCQGRG